MMRTVLAVGLVVDLLLIGVVAGALAAMGVDAAPAAVVLVCSVAVTAGAGMWTWRRRRATRGRRRPTGPIDPVPTGAAPAPQARIRSRAEPDPVAGTARNAAVGSPEARDVGVLSPSAGLTALATDELCAAWQRSYWALRDIPPGPRHWAIVRRRGDLLDELERRDPAGFARWLQTEPRPVSNPGRYLSAGS